MGLRGYSDPRGFQICCLVKIAHYANEPRQESVADGFCCGKLEAPLALAADSGRMTGYSSTIR
jgi:hypothetical protein